MDWATESGILNFVACDGEEREARYVLNVSRSGDVTASVGPSEVIGRLISTY